MARHRVFVQLVIISVTSLLFIWFYFQRTVKITSIKDDRTTTTRLYFRPQDAEQPEEDDDPPNIPAQHPPKTEEEDPIVPDKGLQVKRPSIVPSKGLILIWATVIMPGEIPTHPMCGGGCDVTNDRSRFDDADAVVFMMKSTNRNDLPDPKKRRANQAFVWWSRESAWTAKYFYRKTLDDFDDYFNWTMTHRRDSDVNGMLYPFIARDFVQARLRANVDPAGDVFSRDPGIVQAESLLFPDHVTPTDNHLMEPKVRDVIKQKTGVVAWVASNCDFTEGAKQRLKVVKEVQRSGVKVDIYGRCGNLSIGGNPFYPTLSKYKFYFAFENGVHCRGYITEKLWFNSFYSGAVPIVWGPTRDDVTAISPPNSFIHVDDFKTTSQLTDYLKYLDNNVTAYTEYLAWRWEVPGYFPLVGVNDREYQGELRKAKNHFNNAFCELCRFIKGGLNQVFHKTVPSLKRFWFNPESEDCLRRN